MNERKKLPLLSSLSKLYLFLILLLFLATDEASYGFESDVFPLSN